MHGFFCCSWLGLPQVIGGMGFACSLCSEGPIIRLASHCQEAYSGFEKSPGVMALHEAEMGDLL